MAGIEYLKKYRTKSIKRRGGEVKEQYTFTSTVLNRGKTPQPNMVSDSGIISLKNHFPVSTFYITSLACF